MWQCIALTYSFPNFEPVSCPMPDSKCWFLARIQVSQEIGKMLWYSHFFKNYPQFVVIHTVKGFSQWNRSRCFSGILLLLLWFNECWQFDLWFVAFSKTSLYTWKFSVHLLLKPSLKDFEHSLTSIRKEYNCLVVWTFFGTALLWDWNENWSFPILWPLLSFLNLLTYWVQHFNTTIF